MTGASDGLDTWDTMLSLLAALSEAVVVFGGDGRPKIWNDAARELFAVDDDVLGSRPAGDLSWGWFDENGVGVLPHLDPACVTMETGQPITGAQMGLEIGGIVHPVSVITHPISTPAGRGAIVSLTDHWTRSESEPDLGSRALYDSLTGLPNRRLLLDRLAQALAHANRSHRTTGVVFLDLDHFKRVNDDLGHDVGDRLLATVGARLSAACRPGDTVARLGGDEFVVVYESVPDETALGHLVERLRGAFDAAIEVRGPMGLADLHTSASFGVAAVGDPAGVTPLEMLRRADAAMYEAKSSGRNCTRWFDEELRTSAASRLHLESELLTATEDGQFELLYQPIVRLADRAVIGAEALLRWNHPTRGPLEPIEFVDLAEQNGLIVRIGQWVIDAALRQKAVWDAMADQPLSLSVNVSARQIGRGAADDVAAVVARTGVDPSSITLEITETLLLEAPGPVMDDLHALRDLGVRLALDDFGTGFSPLSHLHLLPIDSVKVDRSLVTGFGSDRRRRAIVRAVIDLAEALDLDVVAEGVESEEEATILTTLGCGVAQGYHLGRPMSVAQLSDLLRDRAESRDRRHASG